MKESILLLSELTLEMIEKVLLGQVAIAASVPAEPATVKQTAVSATALAPDGTSLSCKHCGQLFKGRAGLVSHMRIKRRSQSTNGMLGITKGNGYDKAWG
jgi:hypothetical protein